MNAHLFLMKPIQEVAQKIVEGQMTDIPVVLISKVATPGAASFGPGVKVTCEQYIRGERHRPFGLTVHCSTKYCLANDPTGLRLDVSEKDNRHRAQDNPRLNPHLGKDPNFKAPKVPFVLICCNSCRRRSNLIMPEEVTKLSGDIYRFTFPFTVELTWRGSDPDNLKADATDGKTLVAPQQGSSKQNQNIVSGRMQKEVSAGSKRGRGESTGDAPNLAKRPSRGNMSKK